MNASNHQQTIYANKPVATPFPSCELRDVCMTKREENRVIDTPSHADKETVNATTQQRRKTNAKTLFALATAEPKRLYFFGFASTVYIYIYVYSNEKLSPATRKTNV